MRIVIDNEYIKSYMDDIAKGNIPASKEIKLAMTYIAGKLSKAGVYIDTEQTYDAVRLIEKYFNPLFPWEKFSIALMFCYNADGTLVFDTFLWLMGRGNGKNGFISGIIWYLTSHNHGIKGYNVDIIANNEDQAKTSFDDVKEVLENNKKKLKKFYNWTQEKIENVRTKSYIKFNTTNAKTKDGKRSACLVFDELHEYENWDMIRVFQSGFGKKEKSRTFYVTTDGYVRGGVLDELIELSEKVLAGEINNIGLCPLIYKIDERKEFNDPNAWEKACPSIRYLPNLKREMEKEFVEMQYQQHMAMDFFTKRLNFPREDNYLVVATHEQVAATNRPIPYERIDGNACIGAVDYAQINDFCSVGLLFKLDEDYIWLEHTFVCHKALEVESRKIKFPVKEYAETRPDLITIVNDDVIKGTTVAEWFWEKSRTYNIINIAADDFRKSVLDKAFEAKGLPLVSVRSGPITHSKIAPLVETIFAENHLIIGDNPTMRWYINNVYQEMDKKGNITFSKVEPKLRKTDGFFALLHALSRNTDLPDISTDYVRFGVY